MATRNDEEAHSETTQNTDSYTHSESETNSASNSNTNASANSNTTGSSESHSGYDNYKDYEMGDDVKAAQEALKNAENQKPGEYNSAYKDEIQSLLDSILNREQFQYDFSSDPVYKQYRENYARQGEQANTNTQAAAAALTGGYGNSYGASAGAQAEQEYYTRLNDMIPQLQAAALDRYNTEGQTMQTNLGLMQNADNTEYGRYQDAYNQWVADRDYYAGRADTAYNNDFQKWYQEIYLGGQSNTSKNQSNTQEQSQSNTQEQSTSKTVGDSETHSSSHSTTDSSSSSTSQQLLDNLVASSLNASSGTSSTNRYAGKSASTSAKNTVSENRVKQGVEEVSKMLKIHGGSNMSDEYIVSQLSKGEYTPAEIAEILNSL